MRTITTALWVGAACLAMSGAACAGPTEDDGQTQGDAISGVSVGTLVPETAPTATIVLANADLFAGINELHYTFLRGLFADRALDDVKVIYLTPDDSRDVLTPVRSIDGDRLSGAFSKRFAAQIATRRLTRTKSAVEKNWPRDYFPLTVKDPATGAKRGVRFDYQEQDWNGKAFVVKRVTGPAAEASAVALGMAVTPSSLEIEGGNIMIDDDATLFVTTKVLERANAKTKPQIDAVEAELRRTLGAKDIEWLEPLPGESTGHVDIIAKVLGKVRGEKHAIVAASDGICDKTAPPTCSKRKASLDRTAGVLEHRGYKVTRVTNGDTGGDVRALTYANSLLVNGTAFLPMYFDPSVADDLAFMEGPKVPAKAIIKDCNQKNPFPRTTDLAADLVARERARCALEGVAKAARLAGDPQANYEYALLTAQRDEEGRKAYASLGFRVVQVPGASMIGFGGSVHCISMQLPK